MKVHKTRDILRLYTEGLSRADIARQLKCSPANVSIALKKHGEWDHDVTTLPLEYQRWVIERARKIRQRPADMAARLLMEIIDMYRSGDY